MTDPEPVRKIGFVGTFEVANYGDCLFPVVYMHLLHEHGIKAKFSFHSPCKGVSGLADYGPVVALPSRLDQLNFDTDTLILCGGETLSLGHSSGTYNFPANTLSAFARMWVAPVVAATRRDMGFYVHCVGMPTSNLDPQPVIAAALGHARWVTVRDQMTADRLGNRFPVKVDPVFSVSTLLDPADWKSRAQDVLPDGFAPGQYLCAHVSAPYIQGNLAEWCDQVAQIAQKRGLKVLLLPICHFLDDRATLEFAQRRLVECGMAPDAVQFPQDGHVHILNTAALVGLAAGVVTSSLHAMVTAVSFGIPFACFAGAGKKSGKHAQTLRAAGLSDGIALKIAEITQAFDNTCQQDLASASAQVIAAARRDFAELVELIEQPAKSSEPVPAELLEDVLELDRVITRQPMFEFKRLTLRILRQWPTINQLLINRRRARLSQNLA